MQNYLDFFHGISDYDALHHKVSSWVKDAQTDVDAKILMVIFSIGNINSIHANKSYFAGDKTLKNVAHNIHKTADSIKSHFHDFILARHMGDEFVACFLTKQEDIAYLIEKLDEELWHRQSYLRQNQGIDISLVSGCSIFPQDCSMPGNLFYEDTFYELFNNARLAMIHPKTNLDYIVQKYHHKMGMRMEYEHLIKGQLLSQEVNGFDQFYLVYQPQYRLTDDGTYRIIGAEALIRWRNEVLGEKEYDYAVPPNDFISITERSGMIKHLGEWVVKRAIQDLKTITEACIVNDFRFSINVSAHQFDANFCLADYIQNQLDVNGVSSKHFGIEITESTLIHEFERVNAKIKAINDLGVSVAIDDFGTGYSNLAHLQKLRIDKLKIDKTFVDNVHTIDRAGIIASTLIELAKRLGMSVIAEGVESKEQVNKMIELGCNEFQGYYFSKPIKFNLLIEAIQKNYS